MKEAERKDEESKQAGKMVRSERRDAAEHRQRILNTARNLFAEHGVDAVSMHQIAQLAGVGQGTLYRRFAHKGLLCAALLQEDTAQAQANFRQYLATSSDAPLTRLKALLSDLMNFIEEHAQLLAAMLDAATGERRHGAYNNPFYGGLRQMVTILLKEAIEQGEIAPVDVDYTADAVLAPFDVDLYLYQRFELNFSPERITDGAYKLLFEGLRPL